jgi:hypothetical protein
LDAGSAIANPAIVGNGNEVVVRRHFGEWTTKIGRSFRRLP